MLQDILTSTLTPILSDLLTAFAVTVVTYLTYYVKKYIGYQIEEKHRNALQSALVRAGKLAVDSAIDGKINPRVAVDYLRASVPGAVRHFKVGDDFLHRMSIPAINDAIVSRTGGQ